MDIYITFDVESHSFESNTADSSVIQRIETDAMPRILDLLNEFGARATFFTTASFAEKSPETIKSIVNGNHELGCHGFDHNDYYDSLTLQEQKETLKKSKTIIECISQKQIVSFRAPALRVNKDTIIALEENNFKFDSSVASQRFDGPFTSGARAKLKWIIAPRRPYKLSYHSPFRKGRSTITEVPISSIIWPFISTHLRISPLITFFVMKLLILESSFTNKPLVFLIHPQEILPFKKGKNLKETNIFAGMIRHKLKLNKLGDPCYILFRKILIICKRHNINFKTIREINYEYSGN
jgi:peptidoglycan-N-acetylglucosamine deacetylase